MKRSEIYVAARQIISLSVLVFITLGFFGIGNAIFLALSKMQYGQAFYGGVFFLGLLALTIFFGRVYCSTLCPLGTAQDISAGLATRIFKKRYSFRRAFRLRWLVVGVVVLLFFLGIPVVANLLQEPYALYTRGATRALDQLIGLSGIFKWYQARPLLLPPILILSAILILAFFKGRLFCNTLCPVGVVLGCVSKFSVFRPTICGKCVSCKKCEQVCKSECIDAENKKIDSSRCVMCGNCAAACNVGAINFASKAELNEGKRGFLKSLGVGAFFGALPFISFAARKFAPKILPEKEAFAAIPPGALSWARYERHCMGCHVCIQRCPSKVLVPAGHTFGLQKMFKPVLDFDRGFCQYECTECGRACPARAILPLSFEEKQKIQTGVARYHRGMCIIFTRGECGACAEHCPTGAIEMKGRGPHPVVNKELCVGCGACEYACPALPYKAMIVVPHQVHQTAKVLERNSQKHEPSSEGFKF